jgi:hypothetical protein
MRGRSTSNGQRSPWLQRPVRGTLRASLPKGASWTRSPPRPPSIREPPPGGPRGTAPRRRRAIPHSPRRKGRARVSRAARRDRGTDRSALRRSRRPSRRSGRRDRAHLTSDCPRLTYETEAAESATSWDRHRDSLGCEHGGRRAAARSTRPSSVELAQRPTRASRHQHGALAHSADAGSLGRVPDAGSVIPHSLDRYVAVWQR